MNQVLLSNPKDAVLSVIRTTVDLVGMKAPQFYANQNVVEEEVENFVFEP